MILVKFRQLRNLVHFTNANEHDPLVFCDWPITCNVINCRWFGCFVRMLRWPWDQSAWRCNQRSNFLKWYTSLKYSVVHGKFDFLKIQEFTALNACQRHLKNDLAEFVSRWLWNSRKVHSGIIYFYVTTAIDTVAYNQKVTKNTEQSVSTIKYEQTFVEKLLRHTQPDNCNNLWEALSESSSQSHSFPVSFTIIRNWSFFNIFKQTSWFIFEDCVIQEIQSFAITVFNAEQASPQQAVQAWATFN